MWLPSTDDCDPYWGVRSWRGLDKQLQLCYSRKKEMNNSDTHKLLLEMRATE